MTETIESTSPTKSSGGLSSKLLPELKTIAAGMGIKTSGLKKADLVSAIRAAQGGGKGATQSADQGANKGSDKSADQGAKRRAPKREAAQDQPAPAREESEAPGERRPRRSRGGQAADNAGDNAGDKTQPDQERQERQQDRQGGQERQQNRRDNDQRGNRDRQGQNQDRQNQGGQNQDRQQGNQDRQSQDRSNQGGQNQRRDYDDDGGGRRNRRRRGRDRDRGRTAGGGGGGMGRNEPDTTILEDDVLAPCAGILDVLDNYAFVRTSGYLPGTDDVYVSLSMVRKYGLRRGDAVTGQVRQPREGERKERFNPLVKLDTVNGTDPEASRNRVEFNKLTPLYPSERLRLETDSSNLIGRVIDIAAPIGKGQRGLIVSPAKAGKTMIMQSISNSITTNNPECHLMVVLVDERPEEVTEFKRALPNAEIFASSNDQDVKCHTRISQFAIERAKRLVECGEHVFMLIDSITRMARSFNNTSKNNATMSGGVGVGALEIPRRLFAAARNTRTAGSLTILATALIETGSKMDDLIFLEFKGTGNMELVLDRKIAEQFYYPAVNIFKSGTRREELLLQSFQLDKIHMLRRGLAGHKPVEAIQRVISLLERYPSNAQMLVDLPSKS